MEMDDSYVKQTEIIPSRDKVSECFEKDSEDTDMLPYNPLFPTVYNEQIQESFNEPLGAQKMMEDSCDNVNSRHSCSKESEMALSSKSGNLNVINKGAVCDNNVGSCDLGSEQSNANINSDRETKIEQSASINLPSSVSRPEETETQNPEEESLVHSSKETSSSFAEEQTIIRQSMQAAVETLRTRNLEPVISLHYSSEGTTNSTITLGFASFENLQTGVSERLPDPSGGLDSVTNVQSSQTNTDSQRQDSISSSENLVEKKTHEENNDVSQCSSCETSNSSQKEQKGDRDCPTELKTDADIVGDKRNSLSENNSKEDEICEITEMAQCSSCDSQSKYLPSNSSEVLPSTCEILPIETENSGSHINDISNDNNVPNLCAISEQLEKTSKTDIVSSSGETNKEENDLIADGMLHTGIVVTAVDDEGHETCDSTNEINFRTNSTGNILVKTADSSSGEPQVSGAHASSIPNVEITTDSQTSIETSEKIDDAMEEDDSSDFERVLDQVLNTSDESDGQTNVSESRSAASRTAASMDVDDTISQTGESHV